MIKEAIFSAATVELATQGAIQELDAPLEADVKIEVLELPAKKTLGLFGGSPAKVRASYELSEYGGAEQYIKTILESLGLPGAQVSFAQEEDSLRIQVDCGENYGMVIGRRGETLDAIQHLVRLVIRKDKENEARYQHISINVGDYREKREETLRALALKNADKVKKYGRNVVLNPMTPFERRIVHTVVQGIEGVESHSVGSDDARKVVLTPVGGESRGGYRDRPVGGERSGGFRDRPAGGYRDRPAGDKPSGGYRDRPASGGRDRRPATRTPESIRPPRSDLDVDIGGRYGKINKASKEDSE